MLIVGHRGSSIIAPENTLGSFRLAWEEGADAVELDVHVTRDGHVVVLHDEMVDRTTGASGPVKAMTLAQVQALDAGSWKSPRWRGEFIPDVRQVLQEVPPGKKVFIELKSGPDVVEPLARTLDEMSWNMQQCVFVGFSLPTLIRARMRFPGVEMLLNVGFNDPHPPSVSEVIQAVSDAGLQGVGVGYGPKVGDAVLSSIQEVGQKVFIWTVNDPSMARQLLLQGVDYLASDAPGVIRQALLTARS